jgi:hypothetical protein
MGTLAPASRVVQASSSRRNFHSHRTSHGCPPTPLCPDACPGSATAPECRTGVRHKQPRLGHLPLCPDSATVTSAASARYTPCPRRHSHLLVLPCRRCLKRLTPTIPHMERVKPHRDTSGDLHATSHSPACSRRYPRIAIGLFFYADPRADKMSALRERVYRSRRMRKCEAHRRGVALHRDLDYNPT